MASISERKAERIKRSLAQSTSITAVWTWFLILATKTAASCPHSAIGRYRCFYRPIRGPGCWSLESQYMCRSG
jgi:hypothetical protein